MFLCWALVDRGDVGGCEHGRLDCGLLVDFGIVRFGDVTVGAIACCAPRCVGSSRVPLGSSGSMRRRAVPLCSRRGSIVKYDSHSGHGYGYPDTDMIYC